MICTTCLIEKTPDNFCDSTVCTVCTEPEKRCTQCNKVLAMHKFHKRSDMPWLHRAECAVCYNLHRAKKRASRKVQKLTYAGTAETDNPFIWRTFVQPVQREVYNPMRDSNRHEGART